MKKTTKIALGLGSLAVVSGVSGAFANLANAYRGDPTVKGPNYSVERHSAMEKAFETNDYTAWKSLMENRGRVTQVVNKDNFAQFAKAHELAMKGDLEGSKKIRQELGLGLKDGSGMRNGGGGRNQGGGQGLNR